MLDSIHRKTETVTKHLDAVRHLLRYTIPPASPSHPIRRPTFWISFTEAQLFSHIEYFGYGSDDLIGLITLMMEISIELGFELLEEGLIDDLSFSFVVEYKLQAPTTAPIIATAQQQIRRTMYRAFNEIVQQFLAHYPGLLHKLYLVGPDVPEVFICGLRLPKDLMEKFVVLQNPAEIQQHFDTDSIPLRFGGAAEGTPLTTDRNPVSERPEHTPPRIPPHPPLIESKEMNYSRYVGMPELFCDAEYLANSTILKGGVYWNNEHVVKCSRNIRLAEAEAMKFVSENTTIPVPKITSAYIIDGIGHIIMDYIPGHTLAYAWKNLLNKDEKDAIVLQLKDYVCCNM